MATLTRVAISERALEALGVLAAGQAPNAEDGNRALEATDSRYGQLKTAGLAPYLLSAVPEEFQTPLIHLIAFDLAPTFGVSAERMQLLMLAAKEAREAVVEQSSAGKPPLRIRADYF
jgi:hypothetical protein